MLSIVLFSLMFIGTILFMFTCYIDFKVTRDNAFVAFFTVLAVLLVTMSLCFMHFKPWLDL